MPRIGFTIPPGPTDADAARLPGGKALALRRRLCDNPDQQNVQGGRNT